MTNDELSYLIVRSLTEGEVIETIDEVDRDIIDDMADTDRQIILNFLEKYRPVGTQGNTTQRGGDKRGEITGATH